MHSFSRSIALPIGYQQRDALAFYARDKEGIAEQVMQGSALQMDPAPRSGPQSEQASIRKGVLLCGLPVVVTIVLQQQRAICTLQADCPLPAGASAAIDTVIDAETAAAIDALIAAALPGMLGLRIAPEHSSRSPQMTRCWGRWCGPGRVCASCNRPPCSKR
jgi:hypothetical protein